MRKTSDEFILALKHLDSFLTQKEEGNEFKAGMIMGHLHHFCEQMIREYQEFEKPVEKSSCG